MKNRKSAPPQPENESDWQKTNFANLIRYKPSDVYFARIRVGGKLIRRSLKTNRLSVAKLRLADFDHQERKKACTHQAHTIGKMTFGQTLEIFKNRLKDDPTVKPRTKEYYEYRIKALLKSWPGLSNKDVSEITPTECATWSSKNASQWSSSSHNHTVGLLRKVLQIAVDAGARYDNPAMSAKRVRAKTEKQIVLPETDQFSNLIENIRNSGSGFAQPAADLVEFLAYGGFRKTEARFITWEHCDFKRGEILVTGDPVTGTKNSQNRRVPMITDMRVLLERLKVERKENKANQKIMRVFECQKSLDRATKELNIKRITHHDLRHLFATRCIESGVDIPTVSRWLGHKDGGALAMKVYGHLRDQHSVAMAQKVKF